MATTLGLFAGLLFGFGLIISEMISPAKVLAFLDITGAWDPSLAFVMLSAISVSAMIFPIARKMSLSWLGEPMRIPTAKHIDRRLISGSILFGIGWGLAGFCPGPAVVAVGAGEPKALIFVLGMLVGMILYHLWERLSRKVDGI